MFDLKKMFEDTWNGMFGQKQKAAPAQTVPSNVSVQPARTVSAPSLTIGQPKQQSLSLSPKTVDYQSIDKGLDAGRSWENISKDTNTDFNTIRSYSMKTRPNYGIKEATPQLSMGTQPSLQAQSNPAESLRQKFLSPKITVPQLLDSKGQPIISAPDAPLVLTPAGREEWKANNGIANSRNYSEFKDAVKLKKEYDFDKTYGPRLDPLFKQGKSFEQIASAGGVSTDQVQKYKDRKFPTYGDKGIFGNVATGVGNFAKGMWDSGTGIVTRPFNDLTDLDRTQGEAELQKINSDFRDGTISPEAAMERANKLAGRYTTQKAYQDKNGWIRIGNQNVGEFAGNIAQQGLDTSNLLPVAGEFLSGASEIARMNGKVAIANTLQKGAGLVTGGTSSLATSKLAQGLANRGISRETANLVGNAVTSNAKQAAMYGTLQTGADVANGRGVTPESLLNNYGGTFLMGTAVGIGLPLAARGIRNGVDNIPTPHKVAIAHPGVQELLARGNDLIAQKQALLDRGLSPNYPAVIQTDNAIRAIGAEYNRVYKQVYDAAKLEIQRGFIAGPLAGDFSKAKAAGQVFDGVDGKPRFEVDDSGAKIKNPNGNTLGDVLDHPELYKNYPGLQKLKVVYDDLPKDTAGGINATATKITLNKNSPIKEQLGTILHESQHKIQNIEGFAGGGNPDAIKKRLMKEANQYTGEDRQMARDAAEYDAWDEYKALAGEAEARAVQARMNMPMSERYVKPEPLVYKGKPVDYVYHGTSEGAFRKIREEGLKPSKVNGGENSYFSNKEQYADSYASRKSPLRPDLHRVIRVRADAERFKSDALTNHKGDFTTSKKISPQDIEVRIGNKWIPIQEYADENIGIMPLENPKALSNPTPRSTFYDSLDVPKEDLIIRNGDGKAMSIDDPTAALKQEALKVTSPDVVSSFEKELASYPNKKAWLESLDSEEQGMLRPEFKKYADAYYSHAQPTPKVEAPQATAAPVPKPKTSTLAAKANEAVNNVKTSELAAKVNSRRKVGQESTQTQQIAGNPADEQMIAVSSKLSQKELLLGQHKSQQPLISQQKSPSVSSQLNTTTNSLTAKAKRQSLSPEVVKELQATHQVRNTKELAATAERVAGKLSDKQLIDHAHELLNVGDGKIDDATVALVHQAIQRADTKGNIREAVSLHDRLSEHLTKKGQDIQAASILYQMTPQGRLYKATRDLKRAGVDVVNNPKLLKDLETQTKAIAKAKPSDKPILTAKFMKTVADNIPKSKADNALSVWKAGLLSGVKTHGGNAVSNLSFGVLHDMSNPGAVIADKILAAFGKTDIGKKLGLTGERSRVLTESGRISGMGQGYKKALNTLKTGIDERNIIGNNKYEIHGEINFKNPVVQTVLGKPSNIVFRAMSAGDQPFYYSQLKNSLYDLAKTEGYNKGLRGSKLRKYANDTMINPSEPILTRATQEAKVSVLSQDNKLASGVNNMLNSSGIGKVGQVIAPFVKVPLNFLSRTVDFTPVGYLKAAREMARPLSIIDRKIKVTGKLDQRAFTQAISEATTGTAIIVLGTALSAKGLLSGDYPKSDQKEVQRWKAEGIQPNSVKIGDTWVSLNYLGPVGMLLGASKDYTDNGGGTNGAFSATVGVGNNLTQQSFLTGFSGFSNALNDPERSAKSFISSQAGSVVPSLVNDIANLGDTKQRDTSSQNLSQYVTNSVQNRIPGLRNQLPVKHDVYGNELDQRAGGDGPNPAMTGLNQLNQWLNPLKPSKQINSPVLDEVRRLHEADPNNKDLQVTPTPIDNAVSVGGQKIPLNDEQKRNLQQLIGQATQSAWEKIIKSPQYQALDDTGKADALNKLRQDVTAVQTGQFLKDNLLGEKKLTGRQQAMSSGITNYSNYTNDTQSGGISNISPSIDKQSSDTINKYNSMTSADRKSWLSTQKDAQYQLDLAKYNNDKANGAISDIQNITRTKELAKSKVGANYTQDVRDLYGLSKAQIYNYITNNKNGNSLANDLQAYDQALKDAGLISTLKFKTGMAPSTRTSSGRKTSSKSSKGRFDYKLNGFSGSSGKGASAKDFYDLLKMAKLA